MAISIIVASMGCMVRLLSPGGIPFAEMFADALLEVVHNHGAKP
jgi:hypothetical protein